jgi:hypothetical protein
VIEEKDLKTARLSARLGFSRYYFCTVDVFSEESRRQLSKLKEEEFIKESRMSIIELSKEDLLGERISKGKAGPEKAKPTDRALEAPSPPPSRGARREGEKG